MVNDTFIPIIPWTARVLHGLVLLSENEHVMSDDSIALICWTIMVVALITAFTFMEMNNGLEVRHDRGQDCPLSHYLPKQACAS